MTHCRQNVGTTPTCYRTWLLLQDTLDRADYLWLDGLGVTLNLDQPTHTFETLGGGTHTIAGKRTIRLESTTDKQRDMIVLKYGNTAVLLSEEIVLPGSMSVCTLDRINW